MNYIYKITDKTNGKCYIGQAKNVFSRWSTHCKPESADSMEISRQIQEKGVENFTFEIIEMVSEDEVDQAEIKWIAYYDSFYNGYNQTKGGKDHYLFMRLDVSKEEVVKYWDEHPFESCREVAAVFKIHHQTVSAILKEFDRPITHGKQRVVIRNEKTKECREFVNRADAARYIINNESINLQVRTVQKRLSSDLKFEHYTVIEYYIE